MLAEILKIHQSGRLDEAEQRYNDWLAQHPEDAEALNGLAILRRQKDDLAGAIELSRKAVALAPRRDDFQMTLAGLLVQAREFDDAWAAYEAAHRLNPGRAGAPLGLSQLAMWRGDLQAAEDYLARAERIMPEHAEVMFRKGSLAQARGEHQRALSIFVEMTRRNLANPALNFRMAASFDALGQLDFAEQALRRALEMKPDYLAARVALAQLLIRRNRHDEAQPEVDAALALQPDHPLALAARGDVRRRNGDLPGAVEDYRHAHTLAPMLPGITCSLITALAASGQGSEAQALLDESLRRQPGSTELRRLQLYVIGGDSGAYLQACREWQAASPDNLEPLQLQAVRLELLGRYGEADALCEAALRQDSRLPFARLILARSALRAGDAGAAQEQLNRLPDAVLLPPARVERYQLRGLARDRLDDVAGAVEAWKTMHRVQAGLARPVLPPPVERIAPPVEASAGTTAEPTFLLALPGAGSEGVAALLARGGLAVPGDRFGPAARPDAITTGEFIELSRRAADDATAIDTFRERYLTGLSALGLAPDANVVDWLPFPDLRILGLLAAAFPHARWLVVERDLRDTLLAWLSHGTAQSVAFPDDPGAAGAWIATLSAHLARALELPPAERVLRVPAAGLAEPAQLAQRIGTFLGQPLDLPAGADFRHARGGLPTALPDGRWQAYAEVLAEAFAPLS